MHAINTQDSLAKHLHSHGAPSHYSHTAPNAPTARPSIPAYMVHHDPAVCYYARQVWAIAIGPDWGESRV